MNTSKTPTKENGIVMNVGGRAYIAVPAEDFIELLRLAYRGEENLPLNLKPIAAPEIDKAISVSMQKMHLAIASFGGKIEGLTIPEMRSLCIPVDYPVLAAADNELDPDIAIAESVAAELASGREEHIPAEVAKKMISGDETPVRVWRKYRGLSQAELARRSEVSQPMISNMDRGENIGSMATLRKVADALDITVDDLLP